MVKKHFRLEQVLNLRKELEKACMLDFAVAREELEGATARLQQEEKQLDTLDTELLSKQKEGMSAVELQMYADFFSKKNVDIKEQRGKVDCLDREVTEKRE